MSACAARWRHQIAGGNYAPLSVPAREPRLRLPAPQFQRAECAPDLEPPLGLRRWRGRTPRSRGSSVAFAAGPSRRSGSRPDPGARSRPAGLDSGGGSRCAKRWQPKRTCCTRVNSSLSTSCLAPGSRCFSIWWIPMPRRATRWARSGASCGTTSSTSGFTRAAARSGRSCNTRPADLGFLAASASHGAPSGPGRRLPPAARQPGPTHIWPHRRRHLVRGGSHGDSGRGTARPAIMQVTGVHLSTALERG